MQQHSEICPCGAAAPCAPTWYEALAAYRPLSLACATVDADLNGPAV
ncbi:hypothetical protein ACIRRA_08910 [Nocardia sp. NPDC101769]